MAYALTPEQTELKRTLAELLDDTDEARDLAGDQGSLDRGLWAKLAGLGLIGLSLDNTRGGSSGSIVDEVVVAEELGAHSVALPSISAGVAGHLLASSNSDYGVALSKAFTSGESVVLAALSASQGISPAVSVAQASGRCVLSGSVDDLLESGADVILVPARSDEGVEWYAVRTAADGVTYAEQPALDVTRNAALLTLDAAAAEPLELGYSETAPLNVALVLAATEATGAAAAALSASVEYAKLRHQFGRPIGSFQAIKHHLANMLIATENARSATYNAAWALEEDRLDADQACRMAKAVATENAVFVTSTAIQVHGAIGCTWELGLHLLMRRAKTLELVLGAPRSHFEWLGQHIASAADGEEAVK